MKTQSGIKQKTFPFDLGKGIFLIKIKADKDISGFFSSFVFPPLVFGNPTTFPALTPGWRRLVALRPTISRGLPLSAIYSLPYYLAFVKINNEFFPIII